MRYTNIQYAKAFLNALEGKTEAQQKIAFKNFLVVLRTHRVWPRRQRIVREIEKEYLKQKGTKKVEIESGSPLSHEKRAEILDIVGKNSYLAERINPEILMGIKILIDDELLIDASARRQLERLFRAM